MSTSIETLSHVPTLFEERLKRTLCKAVLSQAELLLIRRICDVVSRDSVTMMLFDSYYASQGALR